MRRLRLARTRGQSNESGAAAVEFAFELYAKKGFHRAFREEERQTDVYWLAWEVTRRAGESVKPFGIDFIETLKSVEVLDSDPLA